MSRAIVTSLSSILTSVKANGFSPKVFVNKESKQSYIECLSGIEFESKEIVSRKDDIDEDRSNIGIPPQELQGEDNNWVQENQLIGAEGELFIKSILVSKYGEDNVKKEPDYAGYDFFVCFNKKNYRIEVKTTVNKKYPFFISINELRKAVEYGSEYSIYWVILEKDKEPSVYVINNPIELLNIDMNYINKSIDSYSCVIQSESFSVKLNVDMINSLEKLKY